MDQIDPPLDEESFDLLATRPPVTFGVPHTLAGYLMILAALGWFFIESDDLVTGIIYNALWLGFVGMIWSAAKIMLRVDYHGWDIFLAWLRLDFLMLDTAEWGGAHLSSLPLRSVYRCAWRPE